MTGEKDNPPKEEEIVEQWASDNYPGAKYWTEVPVSTRQGNYKYIDVVLLERWPFESEMELKEKALQEGMVNINTREYVDDREKEMRFILNNFSDEPVKVRLFEAKRKLNFKAIGQILAYSEFFPAYYAPYAEIEVVEKGIIYGEEDEMSFKTAERNGISPHPVSW